MNEEGTPFNMVCDNSLEMRSVIHIPSKITNNTLTVAKREEAKPLAKLPMKIEATVIKNGNLPLQGTNALVKIEISFSLGESIILHPTTPAALQPNPMHIVVTIW